MKDLGRRIIDYRLITARWWAVIITFFPVLALFSAVLAILLGISPQPLDFGEARHLLANPVELLVFALFILIIGPLPEEIGWRGYLLDRLQSRWSALLASLLLALVWVSWHFPLFWLPGYFEAFGSDPPRLLDFFLGIGSVVIIYTWVYNNTNRSVLAVILFHFMQNLTGEMTGLADEARQVMIVLTAAVSVLIVWYWGPRTLRRARQRQP